MGFERDIDKFTGLLFTFIYSANKSFTFPCLIALTKVVVFFAPGDGLDSPHKINDFSPAGNSTGAQMKSRI